MARFRTRSSSITVTRRGLLRYGAGAMAALAGTSVFALPAPSSKLNCIFINLVGGPSHLDTWDPKPLAPSEYRGPFKAIGTNVAGIQISELFPKMASMMDQLTLIRSVYHDAAPIHETGHQLVQQGCLTPAGVIKMHPMASRNGILLPGAIENTGVQLSHGQEGLRTLSHSLRSNDEAYGDHEFGRSCLLARQAIEAGERFVAINMFRTVYDSLSWDCHADGYSLNVNLNDYRDKLAPMFDATFTTLIRDLKDRGLLDSTLIIATGEFGRSPKINLRGGRDHWTGAWTALMAGAGLRGGQVIGSTDRLGMEPSSRPVHASAIANTMLYALGMRPKVVHQHGEPLVELFSNTRV
jgi:hypothetical protein